MKLLQPFRAAPRPALTQDGASGRKIFVSNLKDRRRAFTLIEVLLGAVLLSALAVSGILGFRVHQRQLLFNQHRVEAVAVADQLLANWANQATGVPIGSTGIIDAQRQWSWQTQLVGMREIFGFKTMIVRLELFEGLPTPEHSLVDVEFVQAPPFTAQNALLEGNALEQQ